MAKSLFVLVFLYLIGCSASHDVSKQREPSPDVVDSSLALTKQTSRSSDAKDTVIPCSADAQCVNLRCRADMRMDTPQCLMDFRIRPVKSSCRCGPNPRSANGRGHFYYFEQEDTYDVARGDEIYIVVEANAEAHARAQEFLKGGSEVNFRPTGTIIETTSAINPTLPFHLNPKTVRFVDTPSIEICDANLGQFVKAMRTKSPIGVPNNFWCPWSGRVVGKVIPEDVRVLMLND